DALDLQSFGGNENVERAFDVGAVGFERIFDRTRNGSARGEVQNKFGFVHGFADDFEVRDAAFDDGDLVADFAEVFFLAARKVVVHDDGMMAVDMVMGSIMYADMVAVS